MTQEEKNTTEESPAEAQETPPPAEAQAPERPAAEQAKQSEEQAGESEEQIPPAADEASGERREGDAQRPDRRAERPRRRFGRRKVCAFCVEKATSIDYKDPAKLRRYLSDRGRIDSRRKTGTCAKHQRWLATALKRARHLALLPYTPEHIRVSGTSTTRR